MISINNLTGKEIDRNIYCKSIVTNYYNSNWEQYVMILRNFAVEMMKKKSSHQFIFMLSIIHIGHFNMFVCVLFLFIIKYIFISFTSIWKYSN